jgi:SAM-dependent methyltransferase
VRLDDPEVVRGQYATEDGLLARRSLYDSLEGPQAPRVVFDAVAEVRPERVLEVGCGPGELAVRIASELGADVAALDISPRMVELARSRGVAAVEGDMQELPFADRSFDCAVAAWSLFHVPDLERALSELARVLRGGGRLVAATNSEAHLEELWALVGGRSPLSLSFGRENGVELLARHFATVERRDVDGWVTIPDAEAARSYIRSTIVHGHLAERVPELDGPVRIGVRNAVFVAETAS